MPKRDLVRDGRLQSKKRTDRSYLRTPQTPAAAPSEPVEELVDDSADMAGAPEAPGAVAARIASTPARPAPAARSVGAARAIQQQGVRKRRELDVEALARRDTSYAMHELRRIVILATMVFVTLVVLAFVLR